MSLAQLDIRESNHAGQEEEEECFGAVRDEVAPQEQNKVMTKLRGMSLSERDEVIDTLISQEGF